MACYLGCSIIHEETRRRGIVKQYFDSGKVMDHGREPDNFTYDESYYHITINSSIELDIEMELLNEFDYEIESSIDIDINQYPSYAYAKTINSSIELDSLIETLFSIDKEFESSIEIDAEYYATDGSDRILISSIELDTSLDPSPVYDIVIESCFESDSELDTNSSYDQHIDLSMEVDSEIESYMRIYTYNTTKYMLRNDISNFIYTTENFMLDRVAYNLNGSIIRLSDFKAAFTEVIATLTILDPVQETIEIGELTFVSQSGYVKASNVTQVTKSVQQIGNTDIIRINSSDSYSSTDVSFKGF